MRKKAAEEVVNSLGVDDEVHSLGNGKIPNVMGPGLLTVTRRLVTDKYGQEFEDWSYSISDTHWDKGVWRAQGGSRGDTITKQKAVELLAAYGRAKSQVQIWRQGEPY